MTSSDERLKIAERLKRAKGQSELVSAIGIDAYGARWTWNGVSNRIANLVYPTPNDSLARIADDLDAMRKELFSDERIEVDVNDDLKCLVHRIRMISGDAK